MSFQSYEEFLIGLEVNDILIHTGVPHDGNPPGRGSGRYPWGSGNRLHQHDWELKDRIYKLENTIDPVTGKKFTQKDIAEKLGLKSTTQLKAVKQMASNAVKQDEGAEISWYWNSVNPDTGRNYTPTEISRIISTPDHVVSESSVRTKYNTYLKGNANKVTETADKLKDILDEKGGYLDVGRGAEIGLEVSPDRLKTSLEMLKQQGYTVETVSFKQITGGGNETTFKVLCPPGTTTSDIYNNRYKIKSVTDVNGNDSAMNLKGMDKPVAIDLGRIDIKYAENGGTDRDGMVEIAAHYDEKGRLVPNSPDLSLGNARYAQVRIAVDGGKECITEKNPTGMKYIKGMAVYSLDVPKGKDIRVNSNKSIEDGPKKALKDMKPDSDMPFGSSVVQTKGKNGEALAINMVGSKRDMSDAHQEGIWGTWSKNLPSQFLAKQSLGLVKQQLKLKTQQSEDEYNDILKLNNPVVKKMALKKFGDQCDSDAVSLKAAPIGGQGVKVLLPVKSLKDNECYCPSLENGTTVALVRFPHAGPFEIPICRVNNSNKEAKIFAGDGRDMVGINSKVAQKLSGADFDGDTAIVIPMTRKNSRGEFVTSTKINSAPSLPHLAGFDPTDAYGPKRYPGKKYHIMTEREKGIEMGEISNLITDMYAKGCKDSNKLSRAVRYSMVVIDAKKHELNYKQAYKDYDIQSIKEEYQRHVNPKTGKVGYGASSLLSRSKSQQEVPARQTNYRIDKETGEKIFRSPQKTTEAKRERVKVEAPKGYKQLGSDGKLHSYRYLKDSNGKDIFATDTGKLVKNKDGSYSYDRGNGKDIWQTTGYKKRMMKSTKMYEAKDARELLSDHPNEIERAYADYANHMKRLGDKARKESVNTVVFKKDPEAAKRYSEEVKSLEEKYKKAKANSPIERQAQLLATSIYNANYNDHPEWDDDDKKKARGQALTEARYRTGAQGNLVTFTDREWEAVNARAISSSKLTQLLSKADQDNYMQLAMPRTSKISDAKRSRIKALYNAGWSYEQIKKSVSGVSLSSIANIVNE